MGVEPTLSGAQGRRIAALLPPAPPYRVDRRGIAPRSPTCDDGVFLFDQQPSSPGWSRTTAFLLIREASFRLTTGLQSCGGRIRTGVGRLMRPRWQPGSSPLRKQVLPAGLEPAMMPPCEGGAVAAGPRERQVGPAGVEPACFRVSGGPLAARDTVLSISLDGWIRTSVLRLPKPADEAALPHPETTVGPEGLEPSPAWLRARYAATNTWIP